MNCSAWLLAGLIAASTGLSAAIAQENQFEWMQCDGMGTISCRDLMVSLNVSPEKRKEVHQARASLFLQGQDFGNAMGEYQEVLLLTPNDPKILKTMAYFEGLRQNWASASAHLRSALRFDPTDLDLRPMLAVSLAKEGDCKGALLELENAGVATPEARKLAQARPIVTGICG